MLGNFLFHKSNKLSHEQLLIFATGWVISTMDVMICDILNSQFSQGAANNNLRSGSEIRDLP